MDNRLVDRIHQPLTSSSVFATDISGFTAWSSSRTPLEVFDLLETIYGAFDKIARRRKASSLVDTPLVFPGEYL